MNLRAAKRRRERERRRWLWIAGVLVIALLTALFWFVGLRHAQGDDANGLNGTRDGLTQDEASASCPGADSRPGSQPRHVTIDALTCLTNFERRAVGVPGLRLDARISRAEQWHADDMTSRDYFAHEAPSPAPAGASPGDRFRRAGFSDWMVAAENIAAGQKTPREVVAGWIRSEGHCKNLFSADVSRIGFGVSTRRAIHQPEPMWAQGLGRLRGDDNASSKTPRVVCPREPASGQPPG